jgi:penicillin-binding protein 1C
MPEWSNIRTRITNAASGVRDRLRQIRLAPVKFWWPQEWWRQTALIVLVLCAGVMAADRLFPPPLARAANVSAVVTDERGAALRAFAVNGGTWRLQADIGAIDPKFIEALLAYEDKRFRAHAGVDPIAIVRAIASSASAGRIVSGGSTISMQTARLLEPRPRNIGAKLIESWRAFQLEERFSKDEILELYLTLAPYGGNLEGVRAASWAYFGREPQGLTPDQIAMLIALPQSPEARRPDLRPENAIRARARVLERLAAEGVFARDLAMESSEYPAPTRRDFPALAWHASEEVLRQSKGAQPKAKGGDLKSTLRMPLQKELEALAQRASDAAGDHPQVAILAVEIKSRKVRAAVGSAGRGVAGGWMDLTTRPRSPGSTLKPFIYGLAFDDGAATSATRISDRPKSFSTYRPSNFDRTFRGDVTVAQALQHSLNVPAVTALSEVGANRFAAALALAGADLSMPLSAEDDAGLAIALGGAGLTVRELTTLYAALGDEGRARPLVWMATDNEEADTKTKDKTEPSHVMSPASANEILSILAASPAPEGRMPARLTQNAPLVAFKTGTSYGYRDAWAAGVSNGYAIVIWIGRADGAPRAGVTGRDAALPALFDAFDAVARTLPRSEGGSGIRIEDAENATAPAPLASFERQNEPPHILFPPHRAEVWKDRSTRSFVLAAEGRRPLSWYVDGEPVKRNSAGDAVWLPSMPGFYKVSVVDAEGRTSKSDVRIRTPEG